MSLSIGKHIDRVVLKSRLARFFAGTFESPEREHWYEMGHFSQGVEMKLDRVKQLNGRKQFVDDELGWLVSGTYEPGQNEIEDYRFYKTMMSGVRNVAMLMGNQLWLFRVRRLGPKTIEDNRISLLTDPMYGDVRRKGHGEFGGWIRNYEQIRVTDFQFIDSSGQFKYNSDAKFIPVVKQAIAQTGPGIKP
jgi:hypothetical protein